jgi:hypothetical protein
MLDHREAERRKEGRNKHEARGITHKKEKRHALRLYACLLNELRLTSEKASLNVCDVPTSNKRSQCGKGTSTTGVSNWSLRAMHSLEVVVEAIMLPL